MHKPDCVRFERSFEGFSRGGTLIRDIQKLIAFQDGERKRLPGSGDEVDLCEEYDLTSAEWFYWISYVRSC